MPDKKKKAEKEKLEAKAEVTEETTSEGESKLGAKDSESSPEYPILPVPKKFLSVPDLDDETYSRLVFLKFGGDTMDTNAYIQKVIAGTGASELLEKLLPGDKLPFGVVVEKTKTLNMNGLMRVYKEGTMYPANTLSKRQYDFLTKSGLSLRKAE